jgi:hypothetical protein
LRSKLERRACLYALALVGIAYHRELGAGLLLQLQQLEELTCPDEADLVDDDDAIVVELVATGFDPAEEGRDRRTLVDPSGAEIGGLAPGKRDAENVPRVGAPSVDERGQSRAFSGPPLGW